jgi:hypothetical protein
MPHMPVAERDRGVGARLNGADKRRPGAQASAARRRALAAVRGEAAEHGPQAPTAAAERGPYGSCTPPPRRALT